MEKEKLEDLMTLYALGELNPEEMQEADVQIQHQPNLDDTVKGVRRVDKFLDDFYSRLFEDEYEDEFEDEYEDDSLELPPELAGIEPPQKVLDLYNSVKQEIVPPFVQELDTESSSITSDSINNSTSVSKEHDIKPEMTQSHFSNIVGRFSAPPFVIRLAYGVAALASIAVVGVLLYPLFFSKDVNRTVKEYSSSRPSYGYPMVGNSEKSHWPDFSFFGSSRPYRLASADKGESAPTADKELPFRYCPTGDFSIGDRKLENSNGSSKDGAWRQCDMHGKVGEFDEGSVQKDASDLLFAAPSAPNDDIWAEDDLYMPESANQSSALTANLKKDNNTDTPGSDLLFATPSASDNKFLAGAPKIKSGSGVSQDDAVSIPPAGNAYLQPPPGSLLYGDDKFSLSQSKPIIPNDDNLAAPSTGLPLLQTGVSAMPKIDNNGHDLAKEEENNIDQDEQSLHNDGSRSGSPMLNEQVAEVEEKKSPDQDSDVANPETDSVPDSYAILRKSVLEENKLPSPADVKVYQWHQYFNLAEQLKVINQDLERIEESGNIELYKELYSQRHKEYLRIIDFTLAVEMYAKALSRPKTPGVTEFEAVLAKLKDSVGDDPKRQEFKTIVEKTIEIRKKSSE